jgi:hypothetical protein
MKQDFFICDVAVVVLIAVEGCEHGFILFGILDEIILLFLLIGTVEDNVMFALKSVLIPLYVANQDKFGVFRSVDGIPLFHQ